MNKEKKGCPVNVEEGTAYKLQKKNNNGLIYSFYWYFGVGMAHIFKTLKFSPNFVSFLSLLLLSRKGCS